MAGVVKGEEPEVRKRGSGRKAWGGQGKRGGGEEEARMKAGGCQERGPAEGQGEAMGVPVEIIGGQEGARGWRQREQAHARPPARVLACPPARPPACPAARAPARLSARLPACSPVRLPSRLPARLRGRHKFTICSFAL
jgi:hypothetical protein